MDTEKLVQDLGEHISRRGFLKRLGAASLAALLGLLGLPQTASALVQWHCCWLCFTPGGQQSWPSCNGTNNQTQKTKWCWNCTDSTGAYQCCEYKNYPATCLPDCDGVYASFGRFIGSGPSSRSADA